MMMRTESDPIMPAFMVSAPGKVIVYGEHSVVHGKSAIAAAVSLRSYLLVTFRSKIHRTVSLRFYDIGLDHTWDIDALPWDLFHSPAKKKTYYDTVTALDDELVQAIRPHAEACTRDLESAVPENMQKIRQAAAMAFLYLFLSLGSPSQHAACVYTLRSTLPVGAGLGSSASVAVCLSSALLLQVRALAGPHPDQPAEESALQVARVNAWAFVAEMAIHGNPSGVDNTVAAGGKAVLFRRSDYSQPPRVKLLRNFPEMPLLLVSSNQTRSTATEVAKVATLKRTMPHLAEPVLQAMDVVTNEALQLIEGKDFRDSDPAVLRRLGELATVNHGLLVALGVSHPKLEKIRATIDSSGLGWTKLTGAGGGGCTITILNPETVSKSEFPTVATGASSNDDSGSSTPTSDFSHSPALSALTADLEAQGFTPFTATLAGDGVGVLWPAVLHNASGEPGGQAIDQEKFLRAEGIDGIEALVGVASSAAAREAKGNRARAGWRFWRA